MKINFKLIKIGILSFSFIVVLSFLFISCMKDRSAPYPIEITRPNPNGIQPAAGSLNIPINSSIQIAFTKPMNLSTFQGRFSIKDFNGNKVVVTIGQQNNDSTVVFTPITPLTKSTIYYAELRGRVRDYHNNSISLTDDQGIFDDTTLIASTWFYTEGNYSNGGFYPVYLKDRVSGTVFIFGNLDSANTLVSALSGPEGMALSGDGQYLIISNTGNNVVQIINTVSGVSEASFTVPEYPSSVAVAGNYAYVICENGQSLCKINIASKTLEKTFALAIYPGKLAISADGNILYTFDQITRDLYLINSADGTTIKTLSAVVSNLVVGEIVVDALTGTVYICDSKGDQIKTIDKNGNSLNTIITYPVSTEPVQVTTNSAFLYSAAGNMIYKYDKNSNTLLDTVSFSTNVKSLTLIPSNDLLYVASVSSIFIIDENTFTILEEKDFANTGFETVIAGPTKR
jgi:hypothetical protein